jgi:hypothetical protein
VQEPGHNYGMQHSSSITCGGAAFADDLASCSHSEYGDKYDTMGGGCYHMNGWQKLYQKWFGGCNGVRTTSSGKFNIYPIESPCNGVQVLQVPFPGAKTRSFQNTTLTSYYLELRTATGFDSKYGAPSVLVHAGGAPILPNTSNPKGLHVWALAAGGTTWGLTAGKSFADPAGGLTITVDSVSTTTAVVDINYTASSSLRLPLRPMRVRVGVRVLRVQLALRVKLARPARAVRQARPALRAWQAPEAQPAPAA